MRATRGDLWDSRLDGHLRVVPVNLGWRADGKNVMGRGVARQAAERHPGLAAKFGLACRNMAAVGEANVCLCDGLIMFPVKPLAKEAPHLSWRLPADLELVRASARQLASMYNEEDVALPLVGCGNGGLDPYDVLPVLFERLRGPGFTLVLTRADHGRLAPLIEKLVTTIAE